MAFQQPAQASDEDLAELQKLSETYEPEVTVSWSPMFRSLALRFCLQMTRWTR